MRPSVHITPCCHNKISVCSPLKVPCFCIRFSASVVRKFYSCRLSAARLISQCHNSFWPHLYRNFEHLFRDCTFLDSTLYIYNQVLGVFELLLPLLSHVYRRKYQMMFNLDCRTIHAWIIMCFAVCPCWFQYDGPYAFQSFLKSWWHCQVDHLCIRAVELSQDSNYENKSLNFEISISNIVFFRKSQHQFIHISG